MDLAAEDDFDRLGVVARRQDRLDLLEQSRRQVDIVGRAGLLVVKMRVGVSDLGNTGSGPARN